MRESSVREVESSPKLRCINGTTLRSRWQRFVGLDTPVSLTLEGWYEWGATKKREVPLRYFLGSTIPTEFASIGGRLTRARWWLADRIWSRQHRLNLRRGDLTGEYRYGYLETDDRLEYAVIAILRSYVEALDDSPFVGEREADVEAREILKWFRLELPELERRQAELDDQAVGSWAPRWPLTDARRAALKAAGELEEQINIEKTKRLMRVLEMRAWLWL